MKTGICALESPNLPSRDDTPLLVCVQGCTPVPGPYDPLRSLGIPWAQTADHSSCFGQCQQHESIRELQVIPSFLMNIPIWCLCNVSNLLNFNLPLLSHLRGNVNFPRRQRCNKCPEGSGGQKVRRFLNVVVLGKAWVFPGLIQDFAGLMLHILWSDINLVDHETIRSIRAPRSRHSWPAGDAIVLQYAARVYEPWQWSKLQKNTAIFNKDVWGNTREILERFQGFGK